MQTKLLTGFRKRFYDAYISRGLRQREAARLLFGGPYDDGLADEQFERKYQPRVSDLLHKPWAEEQVRRAWKHFPELEGQWPEEGCYAETRHYLQPKGSNTDVTGLEMEKVLRAPQAPRPEEPSPVMKSEVEIGPSLARAAYVLDGLGDEAAWLVDYAARLQETAKALREQLSATERALAALRTNVLAAASANL